jgi:AcrR family transcriptional regulator
MSPRTRSAARERAILDAACEVFLKRGYDGATMLEIATVAHVGKGALYGVAPSKEELFLRTVFDVFERMIQELIPELHRIKDPLESLRRIILGLMDTFDEKAPMTWLSFELLARAGRDERLRERAMAGFRALYSQFLAPVRSLIETAQDQGRLAPCDAEALARLLAALIDGLGFQAMFEGPRLPRAAIVETFMRMADSGLGVRPTGRAKGRK